MTEMPEKDDYYDKYLKKLQEKYYFSILNPPYENSFSITMWCRVSRNEDFPITSNTGGIWTMWTQGRNEGREIQASEEFFHAMSLAYHHFVSMGGSVKSPQDAVDEIIDMMEYTLPDHEIWLAQFLVNNVVGQDELIPELGPIVEWIDMGTEWGTPDVKDYEFGESWWLKIEEE